jgi:electron transfer flavoprotein alpha subunit
MADNVLVFVERRDGEIKRPSLQTLSVARRLADGAGMGVDALVLGPGGGDALETLAGHGADRVFVVEAEHLELYAAEAYAACLGDLARQQESPLVLLAASVMGKELAARTAARIGCACASDLVEVSLDGGALVGRRPVYSGKAYARVRAAAGRPLVATLRPNVFGIETRAGASAERVDFESPLAADALGVRTVRVEKPERQELDVAEASVVVSGGRGLKEPENFRLVRDLAEALGGAVGASRAVVDAGWIEHRYQVGQTGKVVSPTLYVACGISGAIQHLAGMSSSKTIVAINKDPDAPIFKVADFGIVGDLFEVLPAMTEAARGIER